MASTSWMKNKDDRAVALAEYRRLRAMTAREVAEVMQPMLGSDNAALKSAAHRLYDGVTPREGYEEGENHEAENTLILDYALLLNDRVGPSPRRQYIDKYADSEDVEKREVAEVMSRYRFTLLRPVKSRKGLGVKCVDLLAQQEVVLVDVAGSEHFHEGCGEVYATGLVPFCDPSWNCFMDTGALMTIPDIFRPNDVAQLLVDLEITRRQPLVLAENEQPKLAAVAFKLAYEAQTLCQMRYR